jgi:(5-formylfuran-3-yl)methyl phosphate synthase
MRLLASVRSAKEVEAAVSGGADIIDAKEPSRGALGAISPEVFAEIQARVPLNLELSAALGDVANQLEVRTSIAVLPVVSRPAPIYLKLGFSGVTSPRQLRTLLEVACAAARDATSGAARIIAVAYADNSEAGSAGPEIVWDAAAAAGASGVLIDTFSKERGQLFNWAQAERLQNLVAQARQAGLLTALAGGLGPEQIPGIFRVDPDVVGFRGALCPSGREGEVSRIRVRQLKTLVAGFGFSSGGPTDQVSTGGETPEPAANLCRPN